MALAEGLSLNSEHSGDHKVHSLDRFQVAEGELAAPHITPFSQIKKAGSFRRAFDTNTRPLQKMICVAEGDVAKYRWDGRPIEILFIDVAKTAALDEHLIREFYPHLIPGQSLLIHQDFLWCETPWLILSMDHFSEYFEVLDDLPYATRIFRCIKKIPSEVAAAWSFEKISFEKGEEAFARTRESMMPDWIPNLLLNQARFAQQKGREDCVLPLLVEAKAADPTEAVIGRITDYFSEFLTGPDWMMLSPSTYDPAFGLISQMSCSEAQLLFSLVYGLTPTRALEVGRARGGSTFVMASALRGLGAGHLVSVDPNCLAEHRIAPQLKGRLADWVNFIDGYAPYVLPEAEQIAGGKFDFVLIDGDHSFEACARDLAGVLPHLEPGAFLLLHDAHYGGVQEAVAKALNESLLADRGSLIAARNESLSHIPYKGHPSYYGGFRLLQYMPAGFRAFDYEAEDHSHAAEVKQLRVENARLRRALAQNTRVWEG